MIHPRIPTPKLLAILSVALILFLRLYRIVDLYTFGIDEEVIFLHAWEQVKDFHPIWIGVSVFQANYYLGPGLIYLTAFFLKISQGDLSILAYGAALTGLLTTYLVYYCGQTITGSRKVAVIAAVLYGGSAWINFFDRLYWNPSFIPLLTILTLYALAKLPQDKRYIILLGILYGAYLHVHISLCILAPIIGIAILKHLRATPKKYFFLAILGYMVVTSPLVVFDYYHGYDNLLMPYRMISKDAKISIPRDPTNTKMSHAKVLFEALGRFWYLAPPKSAPSNSCKSIVCNQSVQTALSLGSILLIGMALVKAKRTYAHILLWSAGGMYVLGFIVFPGYPMEYYLTGLCIILPFLFAQSLSHLHKYVLCIILAAFLTANIFAVTQSNQDARGLAVRKALVLDTIQELHDAPYTLETDLRDGMTYNDYGGWRYAFGIYGYAPVSSFADPVYGWIYKNELRAEKPRYRVVVSDANEYKASSKPLFRFTKGIYHSYIFDYERN